MSCDVREDKHQIFLIKKKGRGEISGHEWIMGDSMLQRLRVLQSVQYRSELNAWPWRMGAEDADGGGGWGMGAEDGGWGQRMSWPDTGSLGSRVQGPG